MAISTVIVAKVVAVADMVNRVMPAAATVMVAASSSGVYGGSIYCLNYAKSLQCDPNGRRRRILFVDVFREICMILVVNNTERL